MKILQYATHDLYSDIVIETLVYLNVLFHGKFTSMYTKHVSKDLKLSLMLYYVKRRNLNKQCGSDGQYNGNSMSSISIEIYTFPTGK